MKRNEINEEHVNNGRKEDEECKKKRKRFSPIWSHFSIKTDNTEMEWAHCNYCEK